MIPSRTDHFAKSAFQMNTLTHPCFVESNSSVSAVNFFSLVDGEQDEFTPEQEESATLVSKMVPTPPVEGVAQSSSILAGTVCKEIGRNLSMVRADRPLDVLYVSKTGYGGLLWFLNGVQHMNPGRKLRISALVADSKALSAMLQANLPPDKGDFELFEVPKPEAVKGFTKGRKFDFVYVNNLIHWIMTISMEIFKEYVLAVKEKGFLFFPYPDAAKISLNLVSGITYQGLNKQGYAVSRSRTELFVDPPMDIPLLLTPVTKTSLEDLGTHPFFGAVPPGKVGPHVSMSVLFFWNIPIPAVEIPQFPQREAILSPRELSAISNKIDHPIPASLAGALAVGTHFYVKEKDNGETAMMLSTLDGKASLGICGTRRTREGTPDLKSYVVSQWERVGREYKLCRINKICISGQWMPYNFSQMMNICCPEENYRFFSTRNPHSAFKLSGKEGYVLTNPYSMMPRYGVIGASMYVKEIQTIDLYGKDNKIFEYKVKPGEPEILRERLDKEKPNSRAQIERMKRAMTVETFLGFMGIFGMVAPSPSQIPVSAEANKLKEGIIKAHQDTASVIGGLVKTFGEKSYER